MNNKRHRPSIDGFTLRRRTQQLSERQLGVDNAAPNMQVPDRFLHDDALPKPVAIRLTSEAPISETTKGIKRSDIDASLNSIDESTKDKKRRRHGHFNRKKIIKRIIIGIILLALALGAFVAIKAFIASSRVFNGNLFDLIGNGQQLKTDQYGRSNILVFGTSEDDPDHEDAGANLTDSIMIISLDQKTKNAALISVPRDIWVKYGKGCTAGFEGKINALYSCYSDDGKNEADGANALKQEVGNDFGIDIPYYAHVNYTVIRQVVDAVGGVDVTIESSDPRGILDRNFDWKCRYQCFYVKYPNGPAHLDGEHALYLARARNDPGAYPSYGLPQGNFDREKNQQKILTALKQKATKAGTFANPAAVTGIIDALGDNVRTNFVGGEVKTLITLGKDIPANNIKSISLVEPGSTVVTTGNLNGQSIVRPIAGIYDFSKIQSYVRTKLTAMNGSESGTIEVLNGSTRSGVAGKKSTELKAKGVDVTSVGDTDANGYPAVSWYDISGGKLPKTAAKLKEVLGVASSGTTLPNGVQSDANFVIIIGDGAN